jgi:hypothetical protein
VIVPEDAELAVLKGAVLFGHKPDYIAARIARYTYGVDTRRDFNPDIDESSRCTVVDGKKKCENIFKLYIKTGSVVEVGAKFTGRYETINPFQSEISSTSEFSSHLYNSSCFYVKFKDILTLFLSIYYSTPT